MLSTCALKAAVRPIVPGKNRLGPSGHCLSRYRAISKLSPMMVLVVRSWITGRVWKGVPSGWVRLAGTPSLVRRAGISGMSTHSVRYGTPLRFRAKRVFHGFGAKVRSGLAEAMS